MNKSQRGHPSPRESFTSSSTDTSKFNSGFLTAPSLSSIDHDLSSSSAIHFLTDSMNETHDFDIIDSLNYDDVDEIMLDHEYMHLNREKIVDTLIKSEESYTNSLCLVQHYFLLPLKKDQKHSTFGFLGMKKVVCTEREYAWLFGNLEDIVRLHQAHLKSLKERMQIWGPTQILSDVFQSWFPHLDIYRPYFNNYAVSITTFERLTRYPPFKKFLDASKHTLDPQFSPATCVHRYFELISQLADLTPPMHPDYAGLVKCKQWIVQFRQAMNEKIQDVRNVDRVLWIHQSLLDGPLTVRAERRLILQGNLSRLNTSTRSMGEERIYLLFTDVLLFVKPVDQKGPRLQYKGHITLDRARVRAMTKEEAGGVEHCIELIPSIAGVDNLNTTFVGTTSAHVLYVGSEADQKIWIERLNYVIHNLDRLAMMKQAQANRKRIQDRAPKGSAIATSSIHSLDASSRSSTSKESNYTN
ncbi:hypothetical protein G6F46_000886 [Rhizopus delemar]|uniref:DH domain-containing protein n=2 Tax=Rhizopus TaxID=4842 RepID=A0A9P7CV15_9FUNG|nr:hypothetical protein G6F55_000312 [Rhizopus delemar]KAG1553178.1 hypothetical protein G6F51_000746 [Rhizopus arrhizus]KAG1504967.1 hypothetical protein G6F54_000627 [Rhizopus delemar]KAG1518338.1 hypothetical protein G6F53_000657 [Rhizopus delemar]KAG1527188.1 hypothetical protein G6F52_001755 [Rhizopus delemar]